jgi:hypothetical protein
MLGHEQRCVKIQFYLYAQLQRHEYSPRLESKGKDGTTQPDLFRQNKALNSELEDPISVRLAEVKPDELTPKQALDLIYELDQLLKSIKE